MAACAATYKPISPKTLNFNAHDLQEDISFSYKYDVLAERGNRKYAKKEEKRDIKLIAVKITNNSDSEIDIMRDLNFYCGQRQITPMEPLAVKNMIKQVVPGYLPYILFTFLNLTVTTQSTDGYDTNLNTDVYHIGYFLGPGLTILNMATAASANGNLLKELNEYSINRLVKPGETVYGIIGVRGIDFSPITVRKR
jgi:hypothetical protein